MAETSSSAASTSTTANSNNSYGYDVFLNHRGPDVKKTFASHLYRRLLSHGIRAFLDQSELEPGDLLTTQIEDAIRSASVQVAIFSTGYAESTWCLNELVLMRESKSPIIPVFYGVKPSDLRWTKGKVGVYAEALERLKNKTTCNPQTHEEKPRYDSKTIENWRNVLCDVAEISGLELEACNGDEGKLVDKVVEQVLKWVKRPALDVAKYPRRLDDKLNDLENTVLFQLRQSGKPQILGIVGLGGVGKTTLAKEFFNRKNSNYTRSCFLFDVRDNAYKNSLNSLQRELVKSLTGLDKPIVSVHEGIGILKMHISSPNVLVILDDVDDEDQVDALLPGLTTLLHSDSLIVITSRNKDVLKRSGVEKSSMYNLTGLTAHHSLELFCLHAFNQPHPRRGFKSLVEEFLHACGGLPLSLKVFGALLNGKNTFYWKDQLDKLQHILPKEIKQTLQISYDALDEEEQHIFLDISCFFLGEDKDKAIRIWDSGLCGFQNIQDKCLVEVNIEKGMSWRGEVYMKEKIRMHDHLRDLGREIAKASRLPRLWRWTRNDIDNLFQQSSEVVPVRGIKMAESEYNAIDDDDAFGRMRGLQLLDTEGVLVEHILKKVQSPNLKWLRWKECPDSSLPSWLSMKNLRVLEVAGEKLKTLWEEESQAALPLHLRELRITAPLSVIPKSIGQLKCLERIVIGNCKPKCLERIVIGNCKPKYLKVRELPKEFCFLQSLKVLVLEDCGFLKSLPECFGNLTNLRHIDLPDCRDLKTLPDSFGNLTNLQHINLSKCVSLLTLPDSFGNLTNLQHVNLYHGSGLRRLPNSFGNLINLQYLHLADCSNLTMSSNILGNTSTLQYISLEDCKEVEVVPLQVAHQRSLERLYLAGTNIKELPDAIGELSDLEVLEVGSPLLETLPDSLGDLRNLKKLFIWSCNKLKCLPASIGQLTQLTELKVFNCPLMRELPASIGQLTQLTVLQVRNCDLMRELPLKGERETLVKRNWILPGLQELHVTETGISEVSFAEGVCFKLQGIYLADCRNLREIGKLPNTLQELGISGCKKLEELPYIETLASLRKLYARGCVKLKSIRGLGQLTKLQKVDIDCCSDLEEVEGIQDCMSLTSLYARECPKLKWSAGVVEQLDFRCKCNGGDIKLGAFLT